MFLVVFLEMFIYFIVINFITLFVYGFDKLMAIKKKSRIEENILFFLAFIGGPIGAFLGMYIFRHKTLKIKFYVWNVLCLLIWLYIFFRFV